MFETITVRHERDQELFKKDPYQEKVIDKYYFIKFEDGQVYRKNLIRNTWHINKGDLKTFSKHFENHPELF